MATAPDTTNVVVLPTAAAAKVKQPGRLTRSRLARDLPRIKPRFAREESPPMRDTPQSTALALTIAICAALPEDVRVKALATLRLLDLQSPGDFTADAMIILRRVDEMRAAAHTLANIRIESVQ